MCIRDRNPEQYIMASDEESESDCLMDDGPACYCIGSDSEAEDCGEDVLPRGEEASHLEPTEGAWIL
eukprot:721798-Alexandrium_andersonii.AAC.1